MAYDASFLTGSEERPVDPISTSFLHNDQAIGELNEEHIVIHLGDHQLTNALESFDMATDVASTLRNSVRAGEKLDNNTYSILKASLNRIVKKSKVGFDNLPAMESIDSDTKRELTIVMENVVTETIKNIWEKIKNAFISMHNKIKTWFIKAFDGAGKLVKQAEALKAKAENMATSTIKNNTFDMGGVKFLNINGKVANPQEIAKGVADITQIGEVLLNKNADSYNKMFNQIENSLKLLIEQAKKMKDSNPNPSDKDAGGDKGKESITEAFNGSVTKTGSMPGSVKNSAGMDVATSGESNKMLAEIFNGFFTNAKSAGIDVTAGKELKDSRWEGDKIFAYRNPKDLLGGIMLVAVLPGSGVNTIESYADFKTGFKISPEPIQNPPKEIDDNGTFTTAPTNLVINICESVITAGNTMMNYKLLFEARDKNTGNLMKQMEQAVSSSGTVAGVGEKHIRNSISATVAIIKKQQDGETRWAKYSFSVLNKSIVYCRNSLSQY